MMNNIFLLTFFLIAKSACAQDTVYFTTGEVRSITTTENEYTHYTSFHKNGNKEEERTSKNGIKIGEWKRYYPSGKIARITSYVNGDYEYSYVSYYESDQLMGKGSAKNANDYEYNFYYETGILQTSLETLENGEQVRKTFYESGNLKQIMTYAPLPNGTWKTFYESGELKRTEEYNNGWTIGVWKEYYENKKLKRTEECIPNTQCRDIKEYHLNGKLKAIGRTNYQFSSSGQQIGSWNEYHDNGKCYKSYQFENGYKTGYRRTYHRNGVLQ